MAKNYGRDPAGQALVSDGAASVSTLSGFDPSRIIRTARKDHRCSNAKASERGVEWARHCSITINKGDSYAEGDCDPYAAGGFGHERFCLSCLERGLA